VAHLQQGQLRLSFQIASSPGLSATVLPAYSAYCTPLAGHQPAERQHADAPPGDVSLCGRHRSFRRPGCPLGGRVPGTAPGEVDARESQIAVPSPLLFGFSLQPGLSLLPGVLAPVRAFQVAGGH
jgi:hypothetical protein